MNKEYTLVYPNGRTASIKVDTTFAVGQHVEWGDRFKITEIVHTLKPQTFDTSITHDVESFVILELV